MIKAHLEESAIKSGARFVEPRIGDAGYDLYASEAVILFPGEQKLIQTGLCLELPPGMVGLVKDRVSMAARRIYTHAGVIDASYRGTISVLLDNQSGKNYDVQPGERVAQLVFITAHTPHIEFIPRNEMTTSIRGDGAFGHTGK
jgi:dUTP pyrophosphatase